VLIGEAARRPNASLKEIPQSEAPQLLRQSWPILELHPARRQSAMPARLAQGCTCHALQLSQNPKDLPPLLHLLRTGNNFPAKDRYARA
jgi:hypothetical protein